MNNPTIAELRHYSSQYYDPVKAHEYYLKNRQLAAKRAGMTKEQRQTEANQNQALSFAKKTIAEKRKAESTKASEDQKAKLMALQEKAKATAKDIEDKLQALADGLKVDATIPAHVNPKVRAFLESMNRNKQSIARGKINAARKDSSSQIKKVRDDLSSAVKKAREDYAKARDAMDQKYKQAAITEQQNIQQNIK